MTATRRKDVLLFSSARTLSNLLCHMLSAQPGFAQASYHFHDAFLHAMFETVSYHRAVTQELRAEVARRLNKGFENMNKDIENAHAEGKPIFIKSHSKQLWNPFLQAEDGAAVPNETCIVPEKDSQKSNPTMLPDDMMLSWIPVFIIRNPILSSQSWLRAERRVKDVDISHCDLISNLSTQFPRSIFDWYMKLPEEQRIMPIVIDADDLVEDDRAINELCRQCNMDPKSVLYEWERKEAPSDLDPHHKSYIQGLWESKGVDKSKSSRGITLDGQYKVWCEEFGSDFADRLQKFSEDNMENYLYMKSFKV